MCTGKLTFNLKSKKLQFSDPVVTAKVCQTFGVCLQQAGSGTRRSLADDSSSVDTPEIQEFFGWVGRSCRLCRQCCCTGWDWHRDS